MGYEEITEAINALGEIRDRCAARGDGPRIRIEEATVAVMSVHYWYWICAAVPSGDPNDFLTRDAQRLQGMPSPIGERAARLLPGGYDSVGGYEDALYGTIKAVADFAKVERDAARKPFINRRRAGNA